MIMQLPESIRFQTSKIVLKYILMNPLQGAKEVSFASLKFVDTKLANFANFLFQKVDILPVSVRLKAFRVIIAIMIGIPNGMNLNPTYAVENSVNLSFAKPTKEVNQIGDNPPIVYNGLITSRSPIEEIQKVQKIDAIEGTTIYVNPISATFEPNSYINLNNFNFSGAMVPYAKFTKFNKTPTVVLKYSTSSISSVISFDTQDSKFRGYGAPVTLYYHNKDGTYTGNWLSTSLSVPNNNVYTTTDGFAYFKIPIPRSVYSSTIPYTDGQPIVAVFAGITYSYLATSTIPGFPNIIDSNAVIANIRPAGAFAITKHGYLFPNTMRDSSASWGLATGPLSLKEKNYFFGDLANPTTK